jgi:hypothetical protein
VENVQRLLHEVVEAGRVAYGDLGSRLRDAMAPIRAANLRALKGSARYAFLINAYNLGALEVAGRLLYRNGRPVGTLKRPTTWLRFFLFSRITVAGRHMSLFTLEFRYLKPFLRRDPRGHFALVCASAGCPPLRDGLYHGDTLEAELDLAARAFLQPGAGYRVDAPNNVLWLSRIFKWYQRDFRAAGGVRNVFCKYAAPEDAAWERSLEPRLRYLDFDWGLNARR